MSQHLPLISSTETGLLGVRHLKRFWAQTLAKRTGRGSELTEQEWRFDNLLLNGLGLPLEETTRYLLQVAPSFDDFEQWVLAKNDGWLAPQQIERLNSIFSGQPYGEELQAYLLTIEAQEDVLSAEDLRFWDENGYVIVRQAVSREQARATEQAVWETLGMHPDSPLPGMKSPLGKAS
ncbi:hypothetical protein [Hymenobacter cellulosilyticus]|uniref:Uncharacterized protein n=1 Tax=Hymenobacter cellulosilyticus TaxID=2932248 RepID=A0A8T9QC72_9BACT|nr:hypothetical protein [Hymenobacter cellulosilyticus]UOQ73961.1 hypothetical protein MUN79_08710 [Hymenobacter cellulosilyticus]